MKKIIGFLITTILMGACAVAFFFDPVQNQMPGQLLLFAPNIIAIVCGVYGAGKGLCVYSLLMLIPCTILEFILGAIYGDHMYIGIISTEINLVVSYVLCLVEIFGKEEKTVRVANNDRSCNSTASCVNSSSSSSGTSGSFTGNQTQDYGSFLEKQRTGTLTSEERDEFDHKWG